MKTTRFWPHLKENGSCFKFDINLFPKLVKHCYSNITEMIEKIAKFATLTVYAKYLILNLFSKLFLNYTKINEIVITYTVRKISFEFMYASAPVGCRFFWDQLNVEERALLRAINVLRRHTSYDSGWHICHWILRYK